MRVIHVGIRPEYEVVSDDENRKVFIEELPDGGHRLWNNKTINSGCGRVLVNPKIKDDLIYCPFCVEMANKNQFSKVESV